MSQHNAASAAAAGGGSSQHGSEWRQDQYSAQMAQYGGSAAGYPAQYPSYPTQDNGLIYQQNHQGGNGDSASAGLCISTTTVDHLHDESPINTSRYSPQSQWALYSMNTKSMTEKNDSL